MSLDDEYNLKNVPAMALIEELELRGFHVLTLAPSEVPPGVDPQLGTRYGHIKRDLNSAAKARGLDWSYDDVSWLDHEQYYYGVRK